MRSWISAALAVACGLLLTSAASANYSYTLTSNAVGGNVAEGGLALKGGPLGQKLHVGAGWGEGLGGRLHWGDDDKNGYRDLGKVRAIGATTEHINTAVWDFTALGIWPIEERFAAYGRIGAYYATQDTSARGIAAMSSSQLTYGGGLQWDFVRGFGARAEWQRYKKVGKDGSFYEVNYYDVLGLAVVYRIR